MQINKEQIARSVRFDMAAGVVSSTASLGSLSVRKYIYALFVLSGIAVFVGACSPDDNTSGPNIAGAPRMTRSALTDPESLIRAATAGVHVRGEQDEMLKVEAQLPGFGGFFIDEAQRMVVYLKAGARPDVSVVRGILAREYGKRPQARVREVMARVAETRIIDGQFSLSELIAAENKISYSSIPIPGYVGVGVSLLRNRVHLGLADASYIQAAMSAVASLGIPLNTVTPEVWGKVVLANNDWGNSYRPDLKPEI